MMAIGKFYRALSLALTCATLAACAGNMAQGPGSQPASPAQAAAQALNKGNYDQASQLYLQAATRASSPASSQQYRLEAGLAAAQSGDAQNARGILAGINPASLGATDQARYGLAQTEIRIASMSPAQALQALPAPNSSTPPAVAAAVWEKRADLFFAQNDPINGISNLAQRDISLMDPAAVRANDNRIYDKALDTTALGLGPDSPSARGAGQTTRGWLALAVIGQSQYASRNDRDQALAAWENSYPGHPANRTVLADRFHYDGATAVAPIGSNAPGTAMGSIQPANAQVTLALPLTGQFQNAAEAIHDGFMFAYSNSGSGMPQPVVFDTANADAGAILAQAQQANTGILVGPLDKAKVSAMASQPSTLPEIALNYVDGAVNRPGFYQFALAPEDEARSVATHAQAAGYTRALALVPAGDWGNRVLDAFRSQFQNVGGQLVDYATYQSDAHDHSAAIQSVLRGYLASGGTSADFIFVAAQPVQARLIQSQLKYYQADQLPMLTTSHSYSGNVDRDKDIDLNGVDFVDMPWVVGDGQTLDSLRASADQQYGDVATDYRRLFAMGMDAWLLAQKLAGPGLQPGDTYEGMTGVLKIEPTGRVQRYMAWATFRGGAPVLLSMPSVTEAQSDDSTTDYTSAPAMSGPSSAGTATPPTSGYVQPGPSTVSGGGYAQPGPSTSDGPSSDDDSDGGY